MYEENSVVGGRGGMEKKGLQGKGFKGWDQTLGYCKVLNMSAMISITFSKD